MKILILGAGNPIPSFIERRLKRLAENNISLIVVLEYGQSFHRLPHSVIVRCGGLTRMTLAEIIGYAIRITLNFSTFCKLIGVHKDLSITQRIKWAIKMMPLATIQTPDLIHYQWIAMAHDYFWLKQFLICPTMASARGSQVTVYPFTRPGYEDIIKKAISAADHIHCVSQDIGVRCASLGADSQKIHVNYNGVDVDLFKPAEKRHSENFEMISVGSLTWRKGYLFQLLLVQRLLKEGYPVNLTIVGEGTEKASLLYSAHLLGIYNQVRFAGKKSTDEVISLLNGSDVYISTSAAEGLANSIVEAVACGLPVVGFTCEGISEIVQENKNGFIVPFGDLESLLSKLKFLTDSGALKKEFSENARLLAVKKFDEKQWIQEMIHLYKTIGGKKA